MRQWTIDAFAAAPFKGNPACVVEPFEAWPDDAWMQALAAENNQAETAFLVKTADPAQFGLRWMTPAVEVPLCGHATLASSHALFDELGVGADRIAFETRSGELTVARAGAGYEMDFPADPPRRIDIPDALPAILGDEVVELWAGDRLVAVMKDEATVRTLAPDQARLKTFAAALSHRGNLGAAATADAGRPYDVVTRFFAPGSGIPEDPTTGSLYCTAGPLFSDKVSRATLRFHQAYPGRGGDVEVEVAGERVKLRGRAVTVVESRLRL